MAHGTPHVGSPMVQSVPLTLLLSLKVGSTRLARSTRGIDAVLGHFGPILAYFGPFSVPGQMGPF